MPVRRIRSLEEMEDSLWREPGVSLWAAIRRVWEFGARVGKQRFPPGVYKHVSLEAAKALRESWDDENFRRFRNSSAEAGAFKRLLDATKATATQADVEVTEPIRAGVRRLRLERLNADGSTRYAEISFVPKDANTTETFDAYRLRWGVFSGGRLPGSFDAGSWGDLDFMARFAREWIGEVCAWEDAPGFDPPKK